MDENLQHHHHLISTTIPKDTSSSSVITGANSSTDLLEEMIPTIPFENLQMAESLSTKWTDEKHRLYLSSMEASFVKQLFSRHEYSSMNMLDCSSRGRSKPDPSEPRPSSSQGQYKVLQSGHWKQLNFDRPQPQPQPRSLDVAVDESPALHENHWIQHYRSGRRHLEVTSPKMEESVGSSTTEVSDQNFPIEDHKGEQLSSFSSAKKMKTTSVDDSTGVDDSNKDQVVPTGESPVMAVPPI